MAVDTCVSYWSSPVQTLVAVLLTQVILLDLPLVSHTKLAQPDFFFYSSKLQELKVLHGACLSLSWSFGKKGHRTGKPVGSFPRIFGVLWWKASELLVESLLPFLSYLGLFSGALFSPSIWPFHKMTSQDQRMPSSFAKDRGDARV